MFNIDIQNGRRQTNSNNREVSLCVQESFHRVLVHNYYRGCAVFKHFSIP